MKTKSNTVPFDQLEPGYYWLAIKGDARPPRVVAIVRGPRGNALMTMGTTGNYDAPRQPYKLSGPLDIPPNPWPCKPRRSLKS